MGRWHPRWRGRARLANSLHTAKRLLIGSPRATRQLRATELPKLLALPVFSADPLSSVAYATEQAMIVLFAVSISGRDLILPLSGAVAALLAIVVLSYRQTVRAYTTSGGAPEYTASAAVPMRPARARSEPTMTERRS